ncbi:hypothetical protein [uncultured Tateyamaria sp.]|nr:hypothetical protein [uncultured Tateyamaria sp.]
MTELHDKWQQWTMLPQKRQPNYAVLVASLVLVTATIQISALPSL